jgi:hypothetical protein
VLPPRVGQRLQTLPRGRLTSTRPRESNAQRPSPQTVTDATSWPERPVGDRTEASTVAEERPTRRTTRIESRLTEDVQAAAAGHTTVMTLTNEVLNVATTVADADLSIPAGFNEVK